MKRTILTSIAFILLALSVQGQKVHDTVFMDYKWNECSRENFTYFRIKTSTEDGYFEKDYFKSGQLQSEGYYLNEETAIPDGPFKVYFENGNIKTENNFIKGQLDGESKTFYPSGKFYYSEQYIINKLDGKRIVYYENGNLKREEIFKNDSLISSVCFKIDGSPDIYFPFRQVPEYIGGEAARIQFLNDNLIYPKKARRNNIMGVVYVTFSVSEEGKVEGVEILRGVHPVLDAEALRIVKKMPSWIPGKLDGENVRFGFNMPVKFTLAG